ncbi:hypothetical protein CPB83DRAFT_772293 [Crepidotus variabilis]|uniref:Uncharacterized protein n=1 Tax=Crepidotus variabilis TaxID=179855 RepID=A0A9P6E9P7_9AGAR|nr:hypothetical protein CPB83DRAFT_772293 [Crepidotus variabilis]
MDALSHEWQQNTAYNTGDRVAFKIRDCPGVAAFECTNTHVSAINNQACDPELNGNAYWRHYPRGFPRKSS